VRNLLDNSLYAVKKLKIKITNKNKNKDFENEILKVFQEIRFLAKIKGEYIVDYNHSWVEVNLKDEKNKERKRINFLTEKDFDFKNCEINDFNQQYETDDILFFEAEHSQKSLLKSDKCFNTKTKSKKISKEKYDNIRLKNKRFSDSSLNFYQQKSDPNSNSLIGESKYNTITDSSSECSLESSSRNISFDRVKGNSIRDLYKFRDKFDFKSNQDFFENNDDEEIFDFDKKNLDKKWEKKHKKFSMHLPAQEKNNKKGIALLKRKSTICIKNKEYLYEKFFV